MNARSSSSIRLASSAARPAGEFAFGLRVSSDGAKAFRLTQQRIGAHGATVLQIAKNLQAVLNDLVGLVNPRVKLHI